jgi:hypothetical protein
MRSPGGPPIIDGLPLFAIRKFYPVLTPLGIFSVSDVWFRVVPAPFQVPQCCLMTSPVPGLDIFPLHVPQIVSLVNDISLVPPIADSMNDIYASRFISEPL